MEKKKIKIKKVEKKSNKKPVKKTIKIQKTSTSKKKFMYYPEFDDTKFYEKIYSKKEFYKNKIPKINLNVDPSNICDAKNFILAPQQEFLKNFISIDTPYNGNISLSWNWCWKNMFSSSDCGRI